MVGLVSTRMRYVELRDPGLRAIDRPQFIPCSMLIAPEDSGTTTKLSSSTSLTSAKNGRHLVGGHD